MMRPVPQPAATAWLCLVGGIFLADLLLPLGFAVPMLYVLPLLLTWFLPARGVSYWAAGGLIGLTILGALCSSGPLLPAALFNRAVASSLLLSIAAGLEQAQQLAGKTAAAVQQSEQAIARIARLKHLSAWSLTLSGDPGHIFDEAACVLGQMFDVPVVYLSEIVGEELHYKFLYINGQIVRSTGRCPLHGTPCAAVQAAKDLCVFDRVMERFPEAAFLRTHQAMAYCGAPSLDSRGAVVAVLCLLDDKPRGFTEEEQELLRIFAQRAAMEIERARHEAESRQAADRLRESEAFLASVLDNLPNMVFVKDAEALRFLRLNKAGEALLGYSHDELLGKSDYDFFPPKEAEAFTAADREVLVEGCLLDIPEEPIHTKALGTRYLHTKKIPIYNAGGTPRYLLGISEDITEHKQEAAARQEQLRLASLSTQLHEVLVHEEALEAMLEQCVEILVRHLDMALARIWLIGPGDCCGRCHKAAHCAGPERCLHLKASAGLSRNLGGEYCRIPLGSLKIGRIATGAGPMWTNEAMNDDRLPNKQWMKDNGLCAFAGFPLMVSGQVEGVLAVFARAPLSDPTLCALEQAAQTVSLGVVRKRAEERVRQSEAFIASVLNHLPSVVFVKEARELRHVRFNRACEELLGVSAQDILGKNNFDLFPAEQAELFTAKDREVLASGRLLDIPEERIDTPQGVRYLHTRKIPMFGAAGEPAYLVGISEDITERKRMEEALRESHAELERRVCERTMDLAKANHALRVEVAERHRMEAQLRESESRLNQAQALAHLGSWELDVEAGRLAWSDETFRIFGIDPGEGVAAYESFLACVHPDDRAAVDAAYAGSIRDGRDSYEIEHRIVVQGTGEIRTVHEKCVHVRNAAGAVVRSLGMVHDVTGRKELEAMRQAHAVMDRVMQERETLMRNLHDGVLQSLYALRLGLEHSRRLLAAQSGTTQESLQASLDVQIEDLGLMIAEVRRFMVGQDPVWAQAGTFRGGLTMLVDSCRGAAPVAWRLELPERDEEMADLPPDEIRHLLYIVREAISNVVRHAFATRCRLALVSDGGRWQMTIEDNGRGFNPAASRRQGLGMGNMEARARQIGAAIEVTAAPGAGTRIVINLTRRAAHVSI